MKKQNWWRSLMAGAILEAAILASPALATADQNAAEGTGAYPAILEQRDSLADHVIYRPKDMAKTGPKSLGVYVFGNGGCSADGTSSRNHLLEIASRGYVAIAPGKIPAPGAPEQRPVRVAGEKLDAPTKPEALRQAIDWIVQESRREGSPFFGKIATDEIAISGWSCGGLQALRVAPDPRVKTVIVMNSGIYNDEFEHIATIKADKAMLNALHGSALYVLGGPTDIAYPNGVDDFRRIAHIPAVMINIPVGHGGTYREPNGGLGARIVTTWLDWKLKGQKSAARMFEGKDCGWCQTKGLEIERKGTD